MPEISRFLGMVMEWASLHQQELLENWDLAKELHDLHPIAPLE